jgi:hypothetical protein
VARAGRGRACGVGRRWCPRKVWGDSTMWFQWMLTVATLAGANMLGVIKQRVKDLANSFLSVLTSSKPQSINFLVEGVVVLLLEYLGRSSG